MQKKSPYNAVNWIYITDLKVFFNSYCMKMLSSEYRHIEIIWKGAQKPKINASSTLSMHIQKGVSNIWEMYV